MMQTMDAMHSNGYQDAGYVYCNVDDCWAFNRSSSGEVQPDPTTFPHGLAALADHAHSLGLFFGAYSDVGPKTCAGRPGSFQHEQQDAETYAKWGLDYMKIDNCDDPATPEDRYPVFTNAFNTSGRSIFFSACEWGVDNPATWMMPVANSWRTTGDINDQWSTIMNRADLNEALYPYSGPGGWNDPDMLEVGNGGCTTDEYTSHFSLWSLMKAPLLIGCDLTNTSPADVAILQNKEVIAISQDSLGVQGRRVWSEGTPDDIGTEKKPESHPGYLTRDIDLLMSLSALGATNLVAETCDGSGWQKWSMDSEGNIREAQDGRCVDIDCCTESKDDPNNVSVFPCHDGSDKKVEEDAEENKFTCGSCGDTNQHWKYDNSTSAFVSALSGQCLTAVETFSSRNAGAREVGAAVWNVATVPCDGSASQKWIMNHDGTISSAIGSDVCLGVFNDVPAGAHEVWSIPLSDKSRAAVLLNRSPSTATITANLTTIGFAAGTSVSVRDLWTHTNNGTVSDTISASVPSHGTVMVRLTPQ